MNVSRNSNVDEKASDSKPFVPSLEITAGQSEPIAANGGWSYMARDHDGDAGTAAATLDALEQIRSGEGQKVIDLIENAPPDRSRLNGAWVFVGTQSA